MTRILFACSALESHGGIQRFNRNLVQTWRELGAFVDVVSLVDVAGQSTAVQEDHLVRVYRAAHRKLPWLARLLSWAVERKYDRIVCGHIHLTPALVPILRVSRSNDFESVLILHGIETWGNVHGLQRLAAKRFDWVLAVSKYTADSFLEQVPDYQAGRVGVFPNTVGAELARRAVRERQVETIGKPMRLLSVARLSRTERDKGIDDVLEAVALLPRALGFEYVVIGEGDDRSRLEAKARGLGIADQVAFRGAVDDRDLWKEYELADVFVLPSRKEGFGIVFLEAMHFGLPVIGVADKGVVDVIHSGENGFLVTFGNPRELSSRILDLAANPDLRRRMGGEGKRLVSDEGEFGSAAFRDRCRYWFCET